MSSKNVKRYSNHRLNKWLRAFEAMHHMEDDDLERANCSKAGRIKHWQCGWCGEHILPRYACGCFLIKK